MAGGFDDFREELREQLVRCAAEAAASERADRRPARRHGVPGGASRTGPSRVAHWPGRPC